MASPSSWFSTIAGDPTVYFGFIRAAGAFEGSQQQIDMQERPGVDGFTVWLKGLRGDPFGIKTETDFASRADALTGYAAGCAMVGSKYVLRRYSGSLGQVVILKCSMESILPARSAVNGTTISAGGNGFILTLNWQLRVVS